MNKSGQSILFGVLLLLPVVSAQPVKIDSLEESGLHNVFQVSSNLFSGSAPDGPEGFEVLRHLGIKTILTVDGSRPDVEEAHKHGLRYAHVPHGYDGIPRSTQILLVKAAQTLEGPIYVHCHHGKHRGPAAVAVMCEGTLGWSAKESIAWMHEAGTATNYVGLYRAAEMFAAPSTEDLQAAPTKFPETAKVSSLVDAMVAVDERMNSLKAIRAAGFKTPAKNPDIVPANEALALKEGFREAQRLPEAQKRGNDFIAALISAESDVEASEKLLQEKARGDGKFDDRKLERSFDAIEKRCASCHQKFRD